MIYFFIKLLLTRTHSICYGRSDGLSRLTTLRFAHRSGSTLARLVECRFRLQMVCQRGSRSTCADRRAGGSEPSPPS